MIDEEIHYFFKYFSERVHYLTRIMTRCQQEGKIQSLGTRFSHRLSRSTRQSCKISSITRSNGSFRS